MKKIVKQDGEKKVFITEDGTEIPFDKINKEPEKKKPIFVKEGKEEK